MFRFRSIDQSVQKIKTFPQVIDKREVYSLIIIILVGLGSFFIGRLMMFEKARAPVVVESFAFDASIENVSRGEYKTEMTLNEQSLPLQKAASSFAGVYVGSRLGNKYHLPTCPGAKQISEVNRVWFASKDEAARAGYVPAGNCKGI